MCISSLTGEPGCDLGHGVGDGETTAAAHRLLCEHLARLSGVWTRTGLGQIWEETDCHLGKTTEFCALPESTHGSGILAEATAVLGAGFKAKSLH